MAETNILKSLWNGTLSTDLLSEITGTLIGLMVCKQSSKVICIDVNMYANTVGNLAAELM